MAKIIAVLRDRVNGDPVASETVTFRNPAGGSIGTDDTGADGSATYQANGNPAGLIDWDATVSGEVRQAGARAQRQIGPIFEAELAKTLKSIMSDGYADNDGDEVAVVTGSGRQVIVGTGCIWVQGIPFHFYDDTPLPSSANATLATRLDRVILRVELDDSATDYGKGTLVFLEGTVSNTLPTVTQDVAGTYEYVLANVTSALGFSSYTSGNISDQRAQAGPTAVGATILAALALKADTSAVTSSLALKANLASPTFTGTVTLPATVAIPDGTLAIADTSGLQTALDSKVADTGDTINGNLTINGVVRVTANGDPDFIIEGAGGADLLYITQTYNAVQVVNSGELSTSSGDAASNTKTFVVDGATGNLQTDGSVEIDGALNHDGTTIGFFGKAPATQASALPAITSNTADATYSATEEAMLNNLKQAVAAVYTLLERYGLAP